MTYYFSYISTCLFFIIDSKIDFPITLIQKELEEKSKRQIACHKTQGYTNIRLWVVSVQWTLGEKEKTGKTIPNVKRVRLNGPQRTAWFPRTSQLKLSREMEGKVTVVLTLWTSSLYPKAVIPDISPPLT